MHSFECALEHVADDGVDFVVRRATRFPAGESAAGRSKDAPALPKNPFLTPEPELVVADVGGTHLALLNKFSVVREHLLVVTRDFVDQRVLLDEADFRALSTCAAGANVLAFYNGGKVAGASQAHKHVQLVTLPLSPRAPVPLEAAFEREPSPLRFRHALERLADGDIARPALLHERYRSLLDQAGIAVEDGLASPYNLVVTPRWMLAVPRREERFQGISINSLAFAGSFFVRDEAQLRIIEDATPLAVLRSVVS